LSKFTNAKKRLPRASRASRKNKGDSPQIKRETKQIKPIQEAVFQEERKKKHQLWHLEGKEERIFLKAAEQCERNLIGFTQTEGGVHGEGKWFRELQVASRFEGEEKKGKRREGSIRPLNVGLKNLKMKNEVSIVKREELFSRKRRSTIKSQ